MIGALHSIPSLIVLAWPSIMNSCDVLVVIRSGRGEKEDERQDEGRESGGGNRLSVADGISFPADQLTSWHHFLSIASKPGIHFSDSLFPVSYLPAGSVACHKAGKQCG